MKRSVALGPMVDWQHEARNRSKRTFAQLSADSGMTHKAPSNPFHPAPDFRHPFIQARRAHERSLKRALDRKKWDFQPDSFQD